jgi:aspartyl-tRNA(Asn)/glutamyl-tRNA(Gln) amidotransferase subunit A
MHADGNNGNNGSDSHAIRTGKDSKDARPLWALSATELVAGYRAAHFTPVDVTESILGRIDGVNPLLNALVTSDRVGALSAALESTLRYRAGKPLSRMDGVPITVKDNIPVKGMRTTWGSRLFSNFIPEKDELPVARLRHAGAIILGKTNCPEFTLQGYTDNVLFGPTRNPWDLAMTPGGSSGGAVAAVAAGLGPVAICTDGGGSIRRPASYTGLIGLKPSRGRVPRRDGFPAILLDFETVGPVARTVADVDLVMGIIAPSDPSDPASGPFRHRPFHSEAARPCRILFIPQFGEAPVDPEIAAVIAGAADRLLDLGHDVETGQVPFDVASIDQAWPVISQGGLAWLSSICPQFMLEASRQMQEIAIYGLSLSAADYIHALAAVRRVESQLSQVFEAYDLVMTPSAAALPWNATRAFPDEIAGQAVGPRGHAVFTAFVNMVGAAGINLPCGQSRSGLPIGLQLISRPGGDGLLTGIASQCEATNFWSTTPPNRIPALNDALNHAHLSFSDARPGD